MIQLGHNNCPLVQTYTTLYSVILDTLVSPFLSEQLNDYIVGVINMFSRSKKNKYRVHLSLVKEGPGSKWQATRTSRCQEFAGLCAHHEDSARVARYATSSNNKTGLRCRRGWVKRRDWDARDVCNLRWVAKIWKCLEVVKLWRVIYPLSMRLNVEMIIWSLFVVRKNYQVSKAGLNFRHNICETLKL